MKQSINEGQGDVIQLAERNLYEGEVEVIYGGPGMLVIPVSLLLPSLTHQTKTL